VFVEDRRKAEAFARGGLDAEREENRLIKKEKEDKHWANHEAFQLMISNAKAEKKKADEAKIESKQTMKEMMAQAKKEKELNDLQKINGTFKSEVTEDDRQFAEDLH